MNKVFFGLALVLIMIVGLAVGVNLVQKKQDTRSRASSSTGSGTITIVPGTVTKYPGQTFSAQIKANTGGAAVGTMSLRLSYPYTGTTPQLDIVDPSGNPANQIYPETALTSTGDWSYPVKSVTRANGTVTIDLAAINTTVSGFVAATDTPIATIYFKVNGPVTANPLTITLDPNESKMMTKADPPVDILRTPANLSYTLAKDATPPAAITDLTAVGSGSGAIVLTWTAPADVGPEGKAASYDVRLNTDPITQDSFSSFLTETGVPVPAMPGTKQQATITRLEPGKKYYFVIESTDAAGNVSGISNNASATTSVAVLDLRFRVQGITQKLVGKNVNITLKNSTTTKTYEAVLYYSIDNAGLFSRGNLPLVLDSLPVSAGGTNYDVYVLVPKYLQKKLGTMTIFPGTNTSPVAWKNTLIKAGDFDNNNVININDISSMLSSFTALTVPDTQANKMYDVNNDGVININDISLVLTNFTALNVAGD